MPVFDVACKVDLVLQTPDGEKRLTVRLPADEEWCNYQRRQKLSFRRHRDNSEETVLPESDPAAVELVSALRQDEGGPEIDEAEAVAILERLSKSETVDTVREGSQYTITLDVPRARTVHRLRMPSAKEHRHYLRSCGSVFRRNNTTEVRANPKASGDFYDKLLVAVEGYAGAVPIVHKMAAVRSLLDELQAISATDSGDGLGDF